MCEYHFSGRSCFDYYYSFCCHFFFYFFDFFLRQFRSFSFFLTWNKNIFRHLSTHSSTNFTDVSRHYESSANVIYLYKICILASCQINMKMFVQTFLIPFLVSNIFHLFARKSSPFAVNLLHILCSCYLYGWYAEKSKRKRKARKE